MAQFYRLVITYGLLMTKFGCSAQGVIKIGGLFDLDNRDQEAIFRYAVKKINLRKDLLPQTKLTYDIERSPPQDSFVAARKACHLLSGGVAALFGPTSSLSAAHVQSICDAMEIPHVETRWNFYDGIDFFSINLYPQYLVLSKAYVDYIEHLKWKTFAIIYETNEGLIKLQELLTSSSDHNFRITVRKLHSASGDNRPILKEIKRLGITRIVLDCELKSARKLLNEALTINMMTGYYHYLLTTLDIELIDLDDFKYDNANITAFRLVDPHRAEVVNIRNELSMMDDSALEIHGGLRTVTALIYDSVLLFANALEDVLRAQQITTTQLSCGNAISWSHGNSLLNYMKMTSIEGLTGKVSFDNHGRRSNFQLDVVTLTQHGLNKTGTWNFTDGMHVTTDYKAMIKEVSDTLRNKHLIVTTILEDPYVISKPNPDNTLQGNDRFEGYCVDILKELSKELNFNYSIHLVEDKLYGSLEGNEWTGMVRELMDQKADLAVASLTISYVREQVIDFTKPFMNLGISILFKRPAKTNPRLFSFLAPLSFQIWLYVVVAYLVVSFMLFVLARFTPYEWYNPYPCHPDTEIVENQFTLMNSLWFTIGSLMQQGSDIAPKAISTRIVSGIWWFFTLIIISSYTANLAAFLTVERMTSPIANADDLSKQTEIKYGTIYGGSTMTFFKTSRIPTYERMWDFMSSPGSSQTSVFVNSTKEGVERVKKGGYAYLLESTMNEYITQRNCDLMQVGGLLDSKGYGIGTPLGSPYRDLVSNAILKLQEEQTLQLLYNKWWKQKGGAGRCDIDEGKQDANSLSFNNVGGVFVVLTGGLLVSLIVVIIEFIWTAHKRSARGDRMRGSLCGEMAKELRFATKCFGSSTKPANRRPANDEKYALDGRHTMLMPPPADNHVPMNALQNNSIFA